MRPGKPKTLAPGRSRARERRSQSRAPIVWMSVFLQVVGGKPPGRRTRWPSWENRCASLFQTGFPQGLNSEADLRKGKGAGLLRFQIVANLYFTPFQTFGNEKSESFLRPPHPHLKAPMGHISTNKKSPPAGVLPLGLVPHSSLASMLLMPL